MGIAVSFLFGSPLYLKIAKTVFLYRLESQVAVCFVRVTGDSNNLLYRLEMLQAGRREAALRG